MASETSEERAVRLLKRLTSQYSDGLAGVAYHTDLSYGGLQAVIDGHAKIREHEVESIEDFAREQGWDEKKDDNAREIKKRADFLVDQGGGQLMTIAKLAGMRVDRLRALCLGYEDQAEDSELEGMKTVTVFRLLESKASKPADSPFGHLPKLHPRHSVVNRATSDFLRELKVGDSYADIFAALLHPHVCPEVTDEGRVLEIRNAYAHAANRHNLTPGEAAAMAGEFLSRNAQYVINDERRVGSDE